jgi:hypothetical protein
LLGGVTPIIPTILTGIVDPWVLEHATLLV